MYDQFIPRYIINRPECTPGHIVTAEEWNNLWQLSVEQGDHVNEGLALFIEHLNQTLLGNDADEFLMVKDDLEQSVPLRTIIQDYYSTRDRMDAAEEDLTTHDAWLNAALEDPSDSKYNAKDANKLGGELPAYYAAASEIERLDGRVDDIAAGAIAAFDHNDISNRSVADAHPMSAITGLSTLLNSQDGRIQTLEGDALIMSGNITTLTNRTHNQMSGRDTANAHPSSAISHGGDTLAAKLANIDLIIASITGTVGELSHADLTNRNASDAHSIAAITGLATALDGKSGTGHKHDATDITTGKLDLARIPTGTTSATVALGDHTHAYAAAVHMHAITDVTGLQAALDAKQKAITVSTSQPSGGVDGDIWIVYG